MAGGSAEPFTRLGTIGIEEEFYTVDGDGRPVGGADTLIAAAKPSILEGRLGQELFNTITEIKTPTAADIAEAAAVLAQTRTALVDHAAAHGYQIAAAGLHPAASWRYLDHATEDRYRNQLARLQYPQHRNITAGLHIHVGVDDADKAMWISNELRQYLPPILALSANSPYWNGFDTGLQSARALIFEGLPLTGMPGAFEDFDAYLAFEEQLLAAGVIEDRGEVWYDVRPHTELGTVEIRIPDTQYDQARVRWFVEYLHTLVLELADRYADGATRTQIRQEILAQNKWQAARYGRSATFLDPAGGTYTLEEFVTAESDRLGIDSLRHLLDTESPAARQRRLGETDPTALYRGLLL